MEFSILGHDRQKRQLASLVEGGRLPHALLFAGTKGVGKRTAAVDFVANLLCARGSVCGACHGCKLLSAGLHPDFTLISGGQSIKIEALRAITKEVYQPPFEAPVRVVLLDDADLMTREAANALLKTLEEPPPSNLFILVSSREQDVPLTVRSRCMRIGFGPLPTETVQSYFEREGLSGQRAADLAAMSGGSIAAGLFWMDEENYGMRQKIAELLMGVGGSFARASALSERMAAKGQEMEYISFLLAFLRDLWWYRQTGDASGFLNGDLAEIIVKGPAGYRWVESSIAEVQEMIRTLRYNVNRWLALENLLVHIMRPA
ncbi:MAG: DNA polymerase III subunit delta' [Syntrophorhabdales bacterium]|jgi:DNA polymerase-3 subunit delta'